MLAPLPTSLRTCFLPQPVSPPTRLDDYAPIETAVGERLSRLALDALKHVTQSRTTPPYLYAPVN